MGTESIKVHLLTLPSWLAVTLIAQVVRRVCADSMIGTRVRGARGEDLSTSGSTVRKFTQTGETCHTVHTSPLVQTGTGGTLVDVHLAEVACWRGRQKTLIHIAELNLNEPESWPNTGDRICILFIHH